MIDLPPVPTWDGLHPLIIHFPIALLLVAPLLVVAAIGWRRHRDGLLLAALLLMVLGTVAVWVSVSTGEAAARLADRTPAVSAVLEHHEELAETSRLVFTVLTAVFAGLVVGPRLLRRPLPGAVHAALLVGFLAVWTGGSLVLASTAHNGGRLVHELGVRSLMPPAPLPAAQTGDEDD